METGSEQHSPPEHEASEDAGDDVYERVNHSFTIEVWRERRAHGELEAVWRGRIVHVLSGKQNRFQCTNSLCIDEIGRFIQPFLGDLETV